ncbi:hypothetical protein ACFFSW_25265 [Saccharothrix longispora]|uniref:hypothetical protein n=1 Tax=Saccharothrix longispora TaxID=33920 RepID=UPI00286C0A24|nr:hypothetical protein [Saccharothrix longispora]
MDPSCREPGAHAALTGDESVQLGRYGDLLLHHLTGGEPYVHDFGPRHGPVRDFAVVGGTVALTRVYHGFVDDRSDRVALVGWWTGTRSPRSCCVGGTRPTCRPCSPAAPW